ncbi:hypothetical protein TSAR_003606 [Trichomalopsis sarcophagae]|uniref:Uncharacterized protein n=1 Tax=Trichomalopsis sarcophagae TaxID=543379 RepID=A0A232EMD4_9HYME|nr:hypothetical protein TSAR_003606 [Trichomalopsis sarcophagae]
MYLTLGGGGDTDTRGSYTCRYTHARRARAFMKEVKGTPRDREYRGLWRRLPRASIFTARYILCKNRSLSLSLYTYM